jgi:ribosomal protein L37E
VNRPHPYYLPETPEEDSLYCSTLSTREEELFNLLIANFIFPYMDAILDSTDPYALVKRYVKRVSEKLTFKLSEKDESKAAFKAFECIKNIRELRANFYTSTNEDPVLSIIVCKRCGQKTTDIPKNKYCTYGDDPDGKNSHKYEKVNINNASN